MSASFLKKAEEALRGGRSWAGLSGDGLAFVLAQVARAGRWVVVTDEPDAADRVLRALRFLHPKPASILSFPADDTRPYDGFSPKAEIPVTRIRTLLAFAAAEDAIVVAPARALRQTVPTREALARASVKLTKGMTFDRDALVKHLRAIGFLADLRAGAPGFFAVRGDVLDVWPAGAPEPTRVDFFDDEIEDLRKLEPQTGKTGGRRQALTILPVREDLLDAAALAFAEVDLGRRVAAEARGVALRRRVLDDLRAGVRFSGIEDWIPALVPTEAPLAAFAGARLVVAHPDDVAASAREHERTVARRFADLEADERPLVPPEERYVPADALLAELTSALTVLDFARPEAAVDLGVRSLDGFAVRGAELGPVVDRLLKLAKDGGRVGLVVDEGRRVEGLREMLAHHEVYPTTAASPWDLEPGRVTLLVGDLPSGFVAADAGFALIPAHALFGARNARKAASAHTFFDVSVSALSQLKDGDLVVHRQHGIGRFLGLQRLHLNGQEQDMVQLEYRGGDRMYVPATRLDQLSRYSPARAEPDVTLDRLGGATWAAKRGKVKDSLLRMAQDLLNLAAKRALAVRDPWPEPDETYRVFEARFPYAETEDQAAAIDAINADLSAEVPMDRLLCGDVGFGKTEVAMRAAMRVIAGGGQVAVMCPTTVLAFQHAQRFEERFAGTGVRVELLSRFRSPSEEKAVLSGLAAGSVDVVIGTHRLLSTDVRYKRLGLVVIDEEHRFGVKQKDRMKKLRTAVDLLSMSATPIPRTLEMALSGMRPMSVIATPPTSRLEVRTAVATLGRARVRDAILKELERNGQVFFVHNRVQELPQLEARLREWVPEARLTVAHGQMTDDALEAALVRFMQHEADVLLCSAIVESGVDLPNVNTMIVNRADLFGLAQLYQLRGRVGRGAARGDCLLLVPEELPKDARKRISVIVEHQGLGSGFAVASADLELRGGGNLVGDAQTGNIDAVGYDAWLSLLAEAIDDAKGIDEVERLEPEIEVPAPTFIPESYVPETWERLSWYKRLSQAETAGEVEDLLSQLESEFGEAPEPLQDLAALSAARATARGLGIPRLRWLKSRVEVQIHPKGRLTGSALRGLCERMPKRFAWGATADGGGVLSVRFTPEEAEKPWRYVSWILGRLKEAGR